jgi:hypothetical protein
MTPRAEIIRHCGFEGVLALGLQFQAVSFGMLELRCVLDTSMEMLQLAERKYSVRSRFGVCLCVL